MIKSLVRLGMSVALGLALALPFLRLAPSATLVAQAQPLEASDFLQDDFSDATGLGTSDLSTTIGNLIRVALGFLGVIAVCIILFGGFKWMVAGGADEKVAEAKRLLIAGVIGLAIILSAYAIAEFVLTSILEASTS